MIIGSTFSFIQNIASTNTYASKLLAFEQRPPEGSVIHTNYQSAGKGQMGNKWESEDGKNLLFSIIIYPDMIPPTDQFIISMTVTLGICDFLKEHSVISRIKWPNDIYVNDDKIAGVLIENAINGNRIESSIIGIGLNINQTQFLGDAPNPVSLRLITGKEYDIMSCLKQITSTLDKRYKQLLSGGQTVIKEDFISSLYRLGERHKFRAGNKSFEGVITGVSDMGQLLVADETGIIKEFSFKEISYILK